MPFNGSGGVTQPASSIYPATANTLIESAKANISIADIYAMLALCLVKDGQQTATQRIPFAAGISLGSQTITALADGTATTHGASVGQVRSGAATLIGTVAGTNTITGALTPALTAYAAGNKFVFLPANTNTGATTINIDSVGAKNVFWNGAACVGGELRQNLAALIAYDGTQFHIIGNGFNAPFLDTHPIVQGSADSTKKVRIEADGITTATTRVLTAPDYDVTLGQVAVKVGSFTRAMTVASGAVAYTGVGFTPRAVHFVMSLASGANVWSSGYDDGTTKGCTYQSATPTVFASTTASLVWDEAGGNSQSGVISAFGADGFTVTWTKTGTPGSTGTINYIAYR